MEETFMKGLDSKEEMKMYISFGKMGIVTVNVPVCLAMMVIRLVVR